MAALLHLPALALAARLHGSLRAVLRRMLPRAPRRALRRFLTRHVTPHLPHDAVYDSGYYDQIDEPARRSAEPMRASIMRELAPRSVLDVGCGTGALLAELAAVEGLTVRGLEYSEAALAVCRKRGLDVAKFDLEADQEADLEPADVVISCEVAEHLRPAVAERYVEFLVRCVRPDGWLVFTAATPGQGGTDHVNEQLHAYWIAKLVARGLHYEEDRSRAWRAEWAGRTARWYSANLMLFRAAATPPAVVSAETARCSDA